MLTKKSDNSQQISNIKESGNDDSETRQRPSKVDLRPVSITRWISSTTTLAYSFLCILSPRFCSPLCKRYEADKWGKNSEEKTFVLKRKKVIIIHYAFIFLARRMELTSDGEKGDLSRTGSHQNPCAVALHFAP